MKHIEAIIKPFKLDDVEQRLWEIGVRGMTVSEVRGFGRSRGQREGTRVSPHAADFIPKVSVEVVAVDEMVQPVVDAILAAARSGEVGDGKVFISTVAEVMRIRTGERGAGAV